MLRNGTIAAGSGWRSRQGKRARTRPGTATLLKVQVLNRGHLVQEVAIAVLLPLGIYFLFDVWLNASMEGRLPLLI